MQSNSLSGLNIVNQSKSQFDTYNDFKILDTLKQQRCQSSFSVFNKNKIEKHQKEYRSQNGQLSKSIQDYGHGMQINIKNIQNDQVNQSMEIDQLKNQKFEPLCETKNFQKNVKDKFDDSMKLKIEKQEAHFSTPNSAYKRNIQDQINSNVEQSDQFQGLYENTNKQSIQNNENKADFFENINCGNIEIEQIQKFQMNQNLEDQSEIKYQMKQNLKQSLDSQKNGNIFQTDKMKKQNIEIENENNLSRNILIKQAFSEDFYNQNNSGKKQQNILLKQKIYINNQKPIIDMSNRYHSSLDIKNDDKICNQEQQAEQNSDLISITVEKNKHTKNSFFKNSQESSSGEFRNQEQKNLLIFDNHIQKNNEFLNEGQDKILELDLNKQNEQQNQNFLIVHHKNHNSFSSQNKQQVQGNLYKSKSMNSYKKDFMVAKGCQSFENKNSLQGMIILQKRQNVEDLEKQKENNVIHLTPNHNFLNYPHNQYIRNASQVSYYEARKSSISPTRSAIGLASINQNKDKVEQVLQDRCAQSLEDLHRVKQEYRAKEQEYEKKIAIMNQEIELLQLQVKETEQREQQQRQIYERIFQALDPQQQNSESFGNLRNSGSASRQKRADEIFNTTQMSFGKEIEQIQKQFHEEMQSRIIELEQILKQKEEDNDHEKQRKDQQIKDMINDLISRDKDSQEKSLQIKNQLRILEDQESQIQSQHENIKNISIEMDELIQKHNSELQNIEKDNQEKYSQLKFIYQNQQKLSKNNQNQNLEIFDEIQIDSYLERIRNLEISLMNSQQESQENKNDIQQRNNQMEQLQDQLEILDQKNCKKKEKIKQFILDQDQKMKECENLRTQIIELEGQAMLNEKILKLNSFNSQINQNSMQNMENQNNFGNLRNSYQEFQNQYQLDDQTKKYQQQSYFQNDDFNSEQNYNEEDQSMNQNINQLQNIQSKNLQKKSGNFGTSFQDYAKQEETQSQENLIQEESFNNLVTIQFEEMQLFDRLKKMIDSTVKMECFGCHKLIPTIQFYDHLIESQVTNNQRHFICEDEQNYLSVVQQLSFNKSILNGEISEFVNQNPEKMNYQKGKDYENKSSLKRDDTFLLSGSIEHNMKNNCLQTRSKSQNAASAQRLNKYLQMFQTTSEELINQEKRIRQTARLNNQSSASPANKHQQQLKEQNDLDYKDKYLNALKIIKKLQNQISQHLQHITQLQLNYDTLNENLQLKNSDAIDLAQEKLIHQLKDEKQKLYLTLDRVKLQLEQKKTQLALLDEKRAENELKLKKEKKQLLQSLLKLREQYQQLLQVHQNQDLQRIEQMNQIGRMAMALSTNGSLMNQIQQANASQKNSSQGLMRDTNCLQENQYVEQDSLLMGNIFPQSILDSGLDKLNGINQQIKSDKIRKVNEMITENYYGENEQINLQEMQNFEYDSEDMQMIEDQYQENLNEDNENYMMEDEQKRNQNILQNNKQKQNDAYQHINNYSQTSYFTSQNQDNNDTQQICNKFSQENTLNSQLYQKQFSKNINLNKTNYIAGYNESQNGQIPFMTQEQNCVNQQEQVKEGEQRKFKIKILDSRTTATRINSQFQSGSNISSNSVIVGARNLIGNGQSERNGKIMQFMDPRQSQMKNENFYSNNKQRA